MFIPGYQDTAALWNEVIDRLPTPGWYARAVNLRHVDDAGPTRRGAILDGYRDQVLDVLARHRSHRAEPSGRRGPEHGCTGRRTGRSGTAEHRRRARADRPGSAGGLPANPRAGSPLRSRSARSHCGLRSGESACTAGQRLGAGAAGAGQRDTRHTSGDRRTATRRLDSRASARRPTVHGQRARAADRQCGHLLLRRTDPRCRGTPIRRRPHSPGGRRRPLAPRRTTRRGGPDPDALPDQPGPSNRHNQYRTHHTERTRK